VSDVGRMLARAARKHRRRARLHEAERRAYTAVRAALAATLGHARDVALTAAAFDPGLLNAARPIWTRELTIGLEPVLATLYKTRFDGQATGAAEQLADVRNRLSADHWAQRLAVLDASIDHVFDRIRDTISAGIAAGEDATELSARVASVMRVAPDDETWAPSIERIARTETILAYNQGAFDAALASQEVGGPELTKEWLATTDERTRHTHEAADGQVVGLREPFRIGGALMQFPGDPEGPPQETINCRCTLVFDEAEPLAAAAPPQAKYRGGMIALRPADPGALAHPDGDPAADLHLTLAFLGEDVGEMDRRQVEDLLGAVAAVAETMSPFTARVAGWGALGAEDAAVLLLNGGEIADAREQLIDELCPECLPEQHEPFIPHLTIGYGLDPGMALPGYGGQEVAFDAISLNLADHEVRFPLSGVEPSDVMTAAVSEIPAQLREYWVHGKGAAKIGWGRGGDFNRCRRNLRKYVPEGHTLDGLCANLHSIATGKYPGRGRGHAASAESEPDVSTEPLVAAMGVADRDRAWNGDDATGRILAHCTSNGTLDVACAARGHLWHDGDPNLKGSWHLPFADVVNGQMVIVPQGVASVAGGHGLRRLKGGPDQAALKRRVCSLYATIRGKYADWPECPFTRGANPPHGGPATADGQLYPVQPPLMPPADWFTDPHLSEATPITITNEGRVYGHLGPDGQCHTGFGDRCETIPHSPSDYAYFRTGEIVTADGQRVPVGQITAGGGHADLSLGWVAAKNHYDDVATAVADVAAGEDGHGVWLAGALRPHVTPEQIRVFMGSRPSGDWRPIRGARELIGAHSVNVPGYPVARMAILASADADDNAALVVLGEPIRYIVASACADCEQEVSEQPPVQRVNNLVEQRLIAARVRAAAMRLGRSA
jgi:2'-5' RNA ligase